MKLPTDEEIAALDRELADEGVAPHDRPESVPWPEGAMIGPGVNTMKVFADHVRSKFQALHPSVNWEPKPFAYLCVSARAVSYRLSPPVVFGQISINPMKFIAITEPELERIHREHPASFWEMMYQAADGIDLFMARINFKPPQPEAALFMHRGALLLEGDARELVEGIADPSLAHTATLAAELILKAVLHSRGVALDKLKSMKEFGHDLPKLCAELAKQFPNSRDSELAGVAASMPNNIDARYKLSSQTYAEGQDVFRRALFICAEALRRTNHDEIYGKMAADPSVPRRYW